MLVGLLSEIAFNGTEFMYDRIMLCCSSEGDKQRVCAYLHTLRYEPDFICRWSFFPTKRSIRQQNKHNMRRNEIEQSLDSTLFFIKQERSDAIIAVEIVSHTLHDCQTLCFCDALHTILNKTLFIYLYHTSDPPCSLHTVLPRPIKVACSSCSGETECCDNCTLFSFCLARRVVHRNYMSGKTKAAVKCVRCVVPRSIFHFRVVKIN